MARSKRQRCHGSGDKDGNSPKRLSTASVSAAPAGCPTFVDLTYSEGDSDEFSVIASRQIRQEAIYCISDEDDDLPGRHSTISGSKSHVRTATVNIYGPKHLMGKIYQALAELKSYLQHPVFLQPDIPYINPQFLYSTGEKTDLRHLVGPKCEDITSDASRSIDGVMDGLDDWDDDLPAERWSMVHFRPELDQYLVTTDLKEYLARANRL
ncbi:hypothetical protein ACHAPO_010417 [Fusarium lateritium]